MKNNKSLKITIICLICIVIGLGGYLVINNNDYIETTSNSESVVKCIDIETPYVTLKFPKEMKDKVTIETNNEDGYKVQFYGHIDDTEELLMEIIFGKEEGILVGHFSVEGESIPVTVIYYEPENMKSLDNDELIYIQNVHMAGEHVITDLSINKKFLPIK